MLSELWKEHEICFLHVNMQLIRGFFRPTGVYDAERLHGLTMIHHTCTGTLKRFKRATIDENRFATFTTS